MKHCAIKLTDNATTVAICKEEYDRVMALIVWHVLMGDRHMFNRFEAFAQKADMEGHECTACAAKLYAIPHDPEFKKLKKMPTGLPRKN